MEFVSYSEKEGVSQIAMDDGKANAMGFKDVRGIGGGFREGCSKFCRYYANRSAWAS